MHTITPTDFLKAAHRTADHFGFLPVETLTPPARSQRRARTPKVCVADRKIDALGGTLTSAVCTYFEHALHDNKPALFFSTAVIPKTGEVALNLQIVGVKKSIAEALLIQTIRSLSTDLGYTNHSVRINSLGDADSVTRYTRELTSYLKKRLEEMPPAARELMKDNAISALLHMIDRKHELCDKTPSPLEYLSDASRRHFREIVEYLDMTQTPYEIDNRLIGHHHCYGDALFAIDFRDNNDERIDDAPFTIRGGRMDAYTKHILNVDVPATGAVMILRSKKVPSRIPKPASRLKPAVFMVQLGFGPKIKSLMLLDTLKQADIPVHQTLVSDSLSEQLQLAESHNVPYSIIIGQKEFVDNSIIIRDMRSRSQQHIPFDTLIPYLKRALKTA